ncbi:MAG: SPOR domain-containing protein [Desulfovibrio sp.]|jgi:cell division protein FtsN|nr:SPOR domain-containing protein [Desulfovibrio sp.]
MENLPKPGAGARYFTFRLHLGSLIVVFVLFIMSVAAVFFLGVIIGRGYSPEERIPELARLMPEAAPPTAPKVIAPSEETGSEDAPLPPATGDASAEAIPRADPDYRDHLKNQSAGARTGNGQPPGSTKPQSPAGRKNEGEAGGVKREAEASVKNADVLVYNYVYQAASYKDEASSEKFARELRAAGIKARTGKVVSAGKVWFRTLVDFTGRPDDTDVLREKLKVHGIPRPILLTKVPSR